MTDTPFPRKAIFLVALLLLPILLLLGAGYILPGQLSRLQREMQVQEDCREISSDIYHLTNSVQLYILSGSSENLNDFYRYSEKAAQSELGVYNLIEQPDRKGITDLIALGRAYSYYVEHEIVKGKQLNTPEYIKLLQSRNNALSQQLVNMADNLSRNDWNGRQTLLEQIFTQTKSEGLFVFPLSLLALGSVFFGVLLAWPWLIRCTCLAIAANNASGVVIIADRNERLLYFNHSAENLFNMQPKQLTGRKLEEILVLYPYLQSILQPICHSISQNQKISNQLLNYAHQNNKISLTVDCTPVYILSILSGAVLVARETQKPKNASILLETIEKERRKLSIEIHDWIGRYMSGIIHGVDFILRGINDSLLSNETKESLISLRAQCQNAAIDMRGIMNDIHPYLIEKMGLIPALESYSDNFERLHNKKIYIFYRHRSLQLDREKEILVYRIIQEALTNVVRHSPATEVDIHFSESENTLKIEIMDNGEMKDTAVPAPGKGLWGMKERARLAGGNMKYGFIEGSFCITLTIPLAEGGDTSGQNWDHAD